MVRRVVSSEAADTVGDLADGEAVLQADWGEVDVERVQVRRKEIFDAGATPASRTRNGYNKIVHSLEFVF
ncbi:hypothetical protein HT576_23025 [Haloterrigena sp. SYSU A121-1]|uniref:Uncharacterized protein n=1 Tax=Haloterrigena gelatinilytica TaxID=2741724 RepID=A0A8J8GSS0_9EURY|nr:hypothetical protein [Haloterrigena gelatinilytica]